MNTLRNYIKPLFFNYLNSFNNRGFGIYTLNKNIDIFSNKWKVILNTIEEDLFPEDPYQKSKFRNNGLQIWDSAFGIKTPYIKPCTKIAVKPWFKCNKDYHAILSALQHVGNIGGKLLRPNHTNIYDLKTKDYGWELLLIAHNHAHLTNEHVFYQTWRAWMDSQTRSAFIQYAAEYTLADFLEISQKSLKTLGIRVYTDFLSNNANLYVPCLTKNAPKFDQDIICVFLSHFIEPPPESFIMKLENMPIENAWAFSPSLFVIWGFTFVDIIYKYPVVVPENFPHIDYAKYIFPIEDLFSIWELKQFIKTTDLISNEEKITFDSWRYTKEYKQILYAGPEFPCKQCILFNPKTEGIPERPLIKKPFKNDLRYANKSWRMFDSEYARAVKTLKPAVRLMGKTIYGEEYKTIIKAQKENYKLRKKNQKNALLLAKAIQKYNQGIALNAKEQYIFNLYCKKEFK